MCTSQEISFTGMFFSCLCKLTEANRDRAGSILVFGDKQKLTAAPFGSWNFDEIFF